MNQRLGFLSRLAAIAELRGIRYTGTEDPVRHQSFRRDSLGVDFTADLKRLAASVAVAALAANLSKKQARAIAATTVEAYRAHLRSLAKRSPLEI